MKNVAFQNSLRNKDSERFTASLREGGTVIPQAANGMTTENTVKENEPNYDAIETKIPIDTELRDNTKFNEYVNFNNASLKGSYKVENKLKPESISAIENFTKDNENVSYPDVYSILYAESSGGQFFHEAAKGPLQIQLSAFVDSQVYQKKYKPVPEKGTPEHDVYMAEAAKDYDKLDELGQVNASLNYLEYLNKRFERNNKRKPTIIESATMYNQGYSGAKPYIADPSTYANNKLLNTYINNVSGVNKAITIPGRNQGGITTEPWEGANADEQTDSVLSRAKQNFVPSSKQLVKDTIEMITHPVQTAKSLYELGSGVVQLAIPGEQGNEDTARAVGQHFADRYGSIKKAKETFATDPAGFAVDALGVITGGASLGVGVAKAGAKAVSKVGKNINNTDMLKTAPMKTVDEMAELTASVKVTDDVISNQIKEFNKGKNLKSNKWTEPLWYHGTGQGNLKSLQSKPDMRYDAEQGTAFGTYLTPDIYDASTYGPYLYTVRVKKDLKVWGGENAKKNKRVRTNPKGDEDMLYKPIETGKIDTNVTPSMLKEYEKSLISYYRGSSNMIPDMLEDFKKTGRLKYGLPPEDMASILRKGGYQAVTSGSSNNHLIMLNPKKDIKIEGVADNSNVAVNVGTHMGHESKLVQAERMAPLDQAMQSERPKFTQYDDEFGGDNTTYKKLDINTEGLPEIDPTKEARINSLTSILNQGDLTRKETAGVIEKLRSLGVPNLAKGGTVMGLAAGGMTTEPWGGSNASLYPPPQRPEGAEPSSVQEQTEQIFK